MVDGLTLLIYVENPQNENPNDGTLKWIATEVSDSSSSDDETMLASKCFKKSKITSIKKTPDQDPC